MNIFKMKSIAAIVGIFLLSACAIGPKKAQLNSMSSQVILSSEAPAPSCKRLDLVTYSYFKGTFFSCDFEDAQNTMKNEAAQLGGNYVKLMGIVDAGVRCQGTGEAYACPSDKK